MSQLESPRKLMFSSSLPNSWPPCKGGLTVAKESYKEDIRQFREAAAAMIAHAKEVRGKVLRPTWKVHILACHVEPFLEEKQVGLGVFCEQTTEAAHCVMKPTVQRFKRKADHLLHGPRLKRACVDFSSKRV